MTRGLKALGGVAVVVGLIALTFAWFNRQDTPDEQSVTRADVETGTAPRTVPPAPDGAPAEGLYVASAVTVEGEVEVQSWLRAAQPVSELTMTTTDPDLLPGSVESLDLVVRDPDGRMLAHRDSVGTNPQTIRLRRPAAELYFTYTVDGGLDDATQTVAGRSLVRVLAMDVDYAGAAGTTTRTVTGPGTVLNVACLDPSEDFEATPRPCGRATADGGWQVELQGAHRMDRLLASLEG